MDGEPGDRETPLITAASYGDADVARELIAAGADLDAVAAPNAGGVPGGTRAPARRRLRHDAASSTCSSPPARVSAASRRPRRRAT